MGSSCLMPPPKREPMPAAIISSAVFKAMTSSFLSFSIITSVLFIGGIELISIGILSEYIGKMYLEIKNRPKYIIKEKIMEETNERDNKGI